ncbi:hypothetical protein Sjap_022295 [Stephania japonica]|uniref:Uncharacterized protein n=1 Tax=Stephania japonica TaxID=461633 RepID=A0AAP0EUC0_9MAGN
MARSKFECGGGVCAFSRSILGLRKISLNKTSDPLAAMEDNYLALIEQRDPTKHYMKGLRPNWIDLQDCAVCLSKFDEGEEIRERCILPEEIVRDRHRRLEGELRINHGDERLILSVRDPVLESTNLIFGEEIENSKREIHTSLGNLLTGLVSVCVGQLSADLSTIKSKGKEVLGWSTAAGRGEAVALWPAAGGPPAQEDGGRRGPIEGA